MHFLKQVWAFSRPHTIVGSAVSILALAIMAVGSPALYTSYFWLSLLSALACNVFITGYNQLVDIDLDKRNKPHLPLASGALSKRSGRAIVWLSLFVALLSAWLVSDFLLLLIASISLLGFAYSWKGLYLKKHHSSAALAIIAVRGFMVNIGFYLHFSTVDSLGSLPYEIWLLTAFVVLFSAGIAWFKDIPDTEGDAEVGIGSLAIKLGRSHSFSLGIGLISFAYLFGGLSALLLYMPGVQQGLLALGHFVLGASFLYLSAKTDPRNQGQIQRFYRFFWLLFFLEYALFATASLLG